ncbi:F0F1 ATP synthase subunit gamma [Prevotella amnii]|jgi:ATP synthase F1, gamma subunit|uniref:ATP synthase gamma chain n=1 Tax=Prevotella amnii CRIS 21A-A TaxID=679191 RepID=E1GYR5_9BACT|nr:F0F1 ATP synthase subunit gamma [Prevotella amnii]EFN90201.1 ATP synthase F1, gamma subunit [Prevotella amnii CRIS 21A-A]
MPSLKEIKTRIASVNSTRKITSAMKMVASSKLHRSQSAIESMLPYEGMLEHILRSFLEATPEIETPYNQERPIKRVALIVYSSSSSLCGGFNTNIIKAMHNAVRSYNEKGFSNKDIVIYTIGRKVYEKAKKMGYTVVNLYSDLAEKPSLERARQLSTEVCQKWIEGDFDKVELIYHHFKSAGTQILTRKTFLPIEINLNNGNDKNNGSVSLEKSSDNEEQSLKDLSKDYFLVEPDIKTVLNTLIPRLLDNMIYTASLDSNASEHAARMVAMQTATDNADELLRTLNLQYNKSRQASITSELLDIMGGSVNN